MTHALLAGSPAINAGSSCTVQVDQRHAARAETTHRDAVPGGSPTISPDGRWIAYASEETDRSEVYVRPFPDVSAGKTQVSTAGGAAPRWSHTGRELLFVNAAHDLIAAEVRTSPSFAIVRQTRLFSTDGYVVGTSPERPLYDVSADDRRFLLLRAGATAGAREDAPQTILVQHFVAELARLLP